MVNYYCDHTDNLSHVKKVLVDGGYSSQNFAYEITKISGAEVEVVKRNERIGEVDGKIRTLEHELEKSRQEVNIMETKCNFLKSLATQAEEFFSLMDKPSFTAEEHLRVEIYRKTLAQQNIESTSDYEYLKGIIAKTEQKLHLSRHIINNKCAALLKEHSDIATTYEEVSQGDYISKLIEQ